MASFHFELVSPDKLMFSGQAESVLVPGSEGDFVVLKDHAPVMASLRPGVVAFEDAHGKQTRIFVRGGFADVSAARPDPARRDRDPRGRTQRGASRPGNPERRRRPRRRARRAEAPLAGKARPPARAQGRDEALEPVRREPPAAPGSPRPPSRGAKRYCGNSCTCCVIPTSWTEVLSASNWASRPRMRLVFSALVGHAVAAAAIVDRQEAVAALTPSRRR